MPLIPLLIILALITSDICFGDIPHENTYNPSDVTLASDNIFFDTHPSGIVNSIYAPESLTTLSGRFI